MSGFEVAGVVLGSIPLIISALEHYANGVRIIRSWGRYKYELKSLLSDLRTEQTLFRNTTEMLLDGMTDSQKLEELLKNPGGELWQDPTLEKKLAERLHTSYGTYMERLLSMADVIGEFQKRLGIDDNGKVEWTDKNVMIRAKEAGKLSISKKAYVDLIDKLKNNNRALQELTSQTAVLQQSRKKRGQARKLKALRDCAQGLFKALQSLKCSCHHVHSAALELSPDPVTSLAAKEPERSADSFDLQLLMTSILTANDNAQISKTIEIRIQSFEKPQINIITQTHTTGWTPANTKGKKVLRWAPNPDPPAPKPAAVGQNIPLRQLTPPPTGRIHPKDYCDLYLQCTKPILPIYVGSLEADISSFDMFALKALQESSARQPTISLRDILHGTIPGSPMLTRFDKLALSAAAANGVLSLYQSSWLKPIFKIDDFAILDVKDASSPSFKRIFISSPAVQAIASHATVTPTNAKGKAPAVQPQSFTPLSRLHAFGAPAERIPTYIRNATMFSLGIALIEICFGRPIDQLRSPDEIKMASIPSHGNYAADYETASRLLAEGRIMEESGLAYESAVRCCIQGDSRFRTNDLDDDEYRQAVYDSVVSLLEDEFRQFTRPLRRT